MDVADMVRGVMVAAMEFVRDHPVITPDAFPAFDADIRTRLDQIREALTLRPYGVTVPAVEVGAQGFYIQGVAQ